MQVDGQRELSVHRDGALMTFSLLLNDSGDFSEGGTYFEGAGGRVWRPQQGVAVLHSGKVATHFGNSAQIEHRARMRAMR